MVGGYENTTGTFGFVLKLPRGFISYQYPDSGARGQFFRGINNSLVISGEYSLIDSSFHSYIAQIVS